MNFNCEFETIHSLYDLNFDQIQKEEKFWNSILSPIL